jgi:hypothetical protein
MKILRWEQIRSWQKNTPRFWLRVFVMGVITAIIFVVIDQVTDAGTILHREACLAADIVSIDFLRWPIMIIILYSVKVLLGFLLWKPIGMLKIFRGPNPYDRFGCF